VRKTQSRDELNVENPEGAKKPYRPPQGIFLSQKVWQPVIYQHQLLLFL
jgi:hypothetical protein